MQRNLCDFVVDSLRIVKWQMLLVACKYKHRSVKLRGKNEIDQMIDHYHFCIYLYQSFLFNVNEEIFFEFRIKDQ